MKRICLHGELVNYSSLLYSKTRSDFEIPETERSTFSKINKYVFHKLPTNVWETNPTPIWKQNLLNLRPLIVPHEETQVTHKSLFALIPNLSKNPPKWFQSDPNVTPNSSQTRPKVTPKLHQNKQHMVPKIPKTRTKVIPTLYQNKQNLIPTIQWISLDLHGHQQIIHG